MYAAIAGLFALAGLVMVAMAVKAMRCHALHRRGGIPVRAELLRTWCEATTRDDGQPACCIRVRFTDHESRSVERDLYVSGLFLKGLRRADWRVTARDHRGSGGRTGRHVDLLYMPDHPEDCIVADDPQAEHESWLMLVGGLVLLAVGAVGVVQLL